MFQKILIANRGEIACRVIRTCQKMNIRTVAVYSDADERALHARMADEAYCIGGAAPKESYLNIARVVAVAQESGADAVHPGYGFLSENPAFARACQARGVCFIGPKPEVMEQVGDKLNARRIAGKARVPILPGTDCDISIENAQDRALELGFPFMVKATEGGGGMGIHLVESMEQLAPLVERASHVAADAFGSPRLYMERQLKGASHIEVQVLGDEHGNVVHLFERDCSIQRRNQKLIEETPAVKLTPKLRKRVCGLAVRFVRFIGYSNAGTVEFLLSQDGKVYFLEMNTRLQVEHGVTELVCGLDIVEQQIRVAAGERLPFRQEDITPHGHAIEARVYPEHLATLLPNVGTVSALAEPAGEYIRVDSALYAGYEVTLHYESLLAKVMAWGETREAAIERLDSALDRFRLEGAVSNIRLLRAVLQSEDFREARHHTGFLSEEFLKHVSSTGDGRNERELAAAIGASLAAALLARRGTPQNIWRIAGRREQCVRFCRVAGKWGQKKW